MRRKIAAIAGALTMVFGLAGPAVASGTGDIDVTVTVQEAGTFTYGLWGGAYDDTAVPVSVSSIPVTTSTGGTVTNINQRLDVKDTRASSPGWTLTFSASDFTDGDNHAIENENIAIYGNSMVNQYGDCLHNNGVNPSNPANSDLVPNSTNPFQVITALSASSASPVSLGVTVNLITATAGRGCGNMGDSIFYKVTIPAGTFTGGGTTTYTSTLTLTNGAAPTSS